MSKKTGVSMNGEIEYTRSEKTKKFIRKIDNIKKKNSKICLECENNKEGYCQKFKSWCGKVNYKCNGYDMSYQDRLQENKFNHRLKKEKKLNKQKKKKANNELGLVLNPKFKK